MGSGIKTGANIFGKRIRSKPQQFQIEDEFALGECDQFLDVGNFSEKLVDGLFVEAQRQVPHHKHYEYDEIKPQKCLTFWPSIKSFSIGEGAKSINEYLSTSSMEEEWVYGIYFKYDQEDECSRWYFYEAIYSLPTERYPIAQATASVYFVFEVSKTLPKDCMVKVHYSLELCSLMHNPQFTEFNEKLLIGILDAKIKIFKTFVF